VLFVLMQLLHDHGLAQLLETATGSGNDVADLLRLTALAAAGANTVDNLPAYLAMNRPTPRLNRRSCRHPCMRRPTVGSTSCIAWGAVILATIRLVAGLQRQLPAGYSSQPPGEMTAGCGDTRLSWAGLLTRDKERVP
jgi:Na+/H+ antiporter NhaD/arsenite permease-like protein